MTTQQDIDNFDANSSTEELVRLAALTKSETNNRIVSVATVDDLPDLTNNTIQPGTVFYVESIKVPVVAQVGCWTGLDNRELRSDFDISFAWAWGLGSVGRLGDNTTIDRSSPVSVVGGFNDWCQVSAGGAHSLAVRTNGTVWAWGDNGQGKLGNNTATNSSSPVSVVSSVTDWCQVSAGGSHSLALRTNGTAWAWGNNFSGQLGVNNNTNRSSPVSVVGGFTDWCQVSAGRYHSLAVRTNGTAWAWGCNAQGRLGDGTTTNRSSPVSVVGGFADWCQISTIFYHGIGVRTNGTAWAWGCNGYGKLGDNTTTNRSSPVSVVGGFTDWCQISAGRFHSVALRTNGTAWAWGANFQGRLGNNTTTSSSSPVSVVGGFTDWCQVSAGRDHSLAVRTNGTAWAWGFNSGKMGDNTTADRSSPVSVVGGFTDWCQVSAGHYHTLAIRKF